jgi:ATP-dependent DNA helicase PIF1
MDMANVADDEYLRKLGLTNEDLWSSDFDSPATDRLETSLPSVAVASGLAVVDLTASSPTSDWPVSQYSTQTFANSADTRESFARANAELRNGDAVVDLTALSSEPTDSRDIISDISANQGGRSGLAILPFFLRPEQKAVLNYLDAGKNVFFTGAAGTGKSATLLSIIEHYQKKEKKEKEAKAKAKLLSRLQFGQKPLSEKSPNEALDAYDPGWLAVTASTGMAASNIGGITLHRWAGFTTKNFTVRAATANASDIKKVVDNLAKTTRGFAPKRWRLVRLVIIDEISMIDCEYLDWLNLVAKNIRKSNSPFGGIQLLIAGDFFQLPPVVKTTERRRRQDSDYQEDKKFAFNSGCWLEIIDKTVSLREVHRQKNSQFAVMLNQVRNGIMSRSTISALEARENAELVMPPGMRPAQLFPTNADVKAVNAARLGEILEHRLFSYFSGDVVIPVDKSARKRQRNQKADERLGWKKLMAEQQLDLKRSAQVMLIKNLGGTDDDNDCRLVNGSLGIVLGFMTKDEFEIIKPKLAGTKDYASIEQTINEAVEEQGNQTISFANLPRGDDQKWPVVRFVSNNGRDMRDVWVEPAIFETDSAPGDDKGERTQLPLILAWAMSIHKSQGQSLRYVDVDLDKTFEFGQAYVALSRAIDLEGLCVRNFGRDKVKVHTDVLWFYASLEEEQEERQAKRIAEREHIAAETRIGAEPLQRRTTMWDWRHPVTNAPTKRSKRVSKVGSKKKNK